MQNKFTFIDLFSGIGGFKMALSNLGGKCKAYSEINKDAIETYCTNFKEHKSNNLGDITKIIELPDHDILTAGVPCQSWSIAGKNLGFDDDRGQLWNDTIYLLQQSKPKAFIFENVKGLVDPRNKEALTYILNRIKEAGYYANFHVVNSYDYGVSQNRIRIYIIGFKDKKYFDNFKLPLPLEKKVKLSDILSIEMEESKNDTVVQKDLFGENIQPKNMSLSHKKGYNDYFLFNDLRNGHTTIHSWDILDTTNKQKEICYLLLKNRRKSAYGKLDGNPLSLNHFQLLDSSITEQELIELIELKIFKEIGYIFNINKVENSELNNDELELLTYAENNSLSLDNLKTNRSIKLKKISITKTIETLTDKKIIKCLEKRYDFKNTKISTGLFGINRIFLPSSDIFPTLVASDTNDFIATKDIPHSGDYKKHFIKEIYEKQNYRKITKSEACLIQGFPSNFNLPKPRARWMKLIGNSVSIPVIEMLINTIIQTGVIDGDAITRYKTLKRTA